MRDYLAELWEHRGDGYYWADHQLELAIICAFAAGSIALVFKAAELSLERALAAPQAAAEAIA